VIVPATTSDPALRDSVLPGTPDASANRLKAARFRNSACSRGSQVLMKGDSVSVSKLPVRPSLESLRKQAKKLAREIVAGSTGAIAGWQDLINK
jgi:hypothetical protein